MSSIAKFKKLAKTRLEEGRLIKLRNDYDVDKDKVAKLQKKSPTSENDIITNLVLQNLRYISFDELLCLIMKAFSEFLKQTGSKPYVLLFHRDGNKSYIWILLLLLRYGRMFLKDLYKEPVDIMNVSTSDLSKASTDINYVFCDDFIFSGTQMWYALDLFRMKVSYRTDYHIYIICGGVGSTGLSKLSGYGAKLYYGTLCPTLGDIIKKSQYKDKYNTLKKFMSFQFGQPFIDRIEYTNCIPIYFEHKLPDAMSSFPHIITNVIRDCVWNDDTLIEDGSSEQTKCAHPFYKVIDMNKGKIDREQERTYLEKITHIFSSTDATRLSRPTSAGSGFHQAQKKA